MDELTERGVVIELRVEERETSLLSFSREFEDDLVVEQRNAYVLHPRERKRPKHQLLGEVEMNGGGRRK